MDNQDDIHPARRRPPHLQEWNSWLDKAIDQARRRGDFDDLPAHGKPLRFDANPLNGEIDVGHGLLKSAGYVPAWIELDKVIRAALDDLATIRDQTTQLLAPPTAPQESPRSTPVSTLSRPWWGVLLGRPRAPIAAARGLSPRHDPEIDRATARQQYLGRAREIDAKIAAFNASLPPELWRHERASLPAERAAKDFDEAILVRAETSGQVCRH